MRYLTTLALALIIFMSVKSSNAVEFRAQTQDLNVKVSDIAQDKVDLVAPYGYHEDHGFEPIYKVADWACGLYQRYAVGLSIWPSDVSCDEMGAAMARREWSCEHYYRFACAIPDAPKR